MSQIYNSEPGRLFSEMCVGKVRVSGEGRVCRMVME